MEKTKKLEEMRREVERSGGELRRLERLEAQFEVQEKMEEYIEARNNRRLWEASHIELVKAYYKELENEIGEDDIEEALEEGLEDLMEDEEAFEGLFDFEEEEDGEEDDTPTRPREEQVEEVGKDLDQLQGQVLSLIDELAFLKDDVVNFLGCESEAFDEVLDRLEEANEILTRILSDNYPIE